jgi:hypothetical protein
MATTTGQARTLVSRAVIWAGLAVGTCLTVLAVMHGIRVPRLEVVLSVLATWALLAALAVTVLEMLRRHYRVLRHHGKRGAVAVACGTRSGARSATAWLVSKVGPRWENREYGPLMFRRLRGGPEGPEPQEESGEGTQGSGEAGGPTYSWGPAGSPSGWPAQGPAAAHRWARHMSTGGGKPQVVTEYPPGGGPGRTVATYVNGKPAPDHTDTDGGITSMTGTNSSGSRPDSGVTGWRPVRAGSHIAPERRARRTAARAGGSVPAAWGPVIALAADFEPEDDAALLEWMNGQVTGMGGYGEALVELYEHCTSVIGIDPAASALLHDVADAVAHAAEAMAAAKQKFVDHYELPREFAGNGGLMTHDGRWVTGEGA